MGLFFYVFKLVVYNVEFIIRGGLMNKKMILVIVTFVLFITSMVSGKLYWNKQAKNITGQTMETGTKQVKGTEGSRKTEEKVKNENVSLNEKYARKLPDSVKGKLKEAAKEDRAVNLVIVGDQASSRESGTWTESFITSLDAAYGKGIWNVTVKDFKDESTEELLNKKRYKDIIKENPDVLLFEPPFITDNNKIGNGNSVKNTKDFVQLISDNKKDVVVLLQPPNPVYNAKNYPKAIESLKQFAEQSGYTYLDHWDAWPNATTKEILSYLQEDFGFPSKQGHEIWAQYITKYFVADK